MPTIAHTAATAGTITTSRTASRGAAASTSTDGRSASVEAPPVPDRRSVQAAAGRSTAPAEAQSAPETAGAAVAPEAPLAAPPQTHTLQNFKLSDLQQFTNQPIDPNADFHIFYAGKDNVHGILNYLMSGVTQSVNLNMYGYDDPQLNAQCMRCAADPNISTSITLDKSQAQSGHERAILNGDEQQNASAFNNHFVIGDSATHQISHTKGGVLDDKVGFEGSVNWSAGGEGTFVNGSMTPGGAGYIAQNNTLVVFTNPAEIASFKAELQSEHQIAASQGTTLANLSTAPAS